MKTCLVANTDWYLANFRLNLATALHDRGHEVHCIAPAGKYLDLLGEKGFHTHPLKLGSDSFSPLENRQTQNHLSTLYAEIQPDLVHHFTPRCVVLGSLAASKADVPLVINALTGLGHLFTSESFKAKAARPVIRRLLRDQLNRPGRAVIFQNEYDRDELVEAGIAQAEFCHVIRGSGVDTEAFRPRVEERADDEVRVLFASRLIAEKGITELVAAMSIVFEEFPNARLWVAGEAYEQNPTSLTPEDIAAIGRMPFAKYLGHRDDMADILAEVDIVALPTYREGTPKILLEAGACGLPIVATDVPGCRGVVKDGFSGYLVPVRTVEPVTRAIRRLCGDAERRHRMGARGREIIEAGFSSEIVVARTLAIYDQLIAPAI